jgi:hypothetical protein
MKHSWLNTTKSRTRWFQFRLRTLMLLMLLASLGLSWLRIEMTKAQRRQEAVSAIQSLGGEVLYDYQGKTSGSAPPTTPPSPPQTWLHKLFGRDLFDRVLSVHFYSCPGRPGIGDADLMPHLEPLSDLRDVNLCDTNITNQGLRCLENHQDLRSLDLASTKINEGDLDHLTGLRLRRLSLFGTRASDAGLKSLKDMQSLRELNLHGTRVTDAGLTSLQGLKGLQSLNLTRTNVTDAGLKHLEGLGTLNTLSLRRTHVSRQGAERLQAKLPNCTVYWEPLMPQESRRLPAAVPEGFRTSFIMLPICRDNARFSPGDHVDVLLARGDTYGNEVILRDAVVHSVMLACGMFDVKSLDKGAIQVNLVIATDEVRPLMAARTDAKQDAQKRLSLRRACNVGSDQAASTRESQHPR